MLRDNQQFNKSIKSNSAFLDELRQKMPEFFTTTKYDEEGNVVESSTFDNEKFQQALKEHNIDELSSGYRLDFIGKNYAKKQAGERPTTVIVPDNDHNQKAENKNSKNLFFTGDNLEVLRHLQQNYANSVDFIYIDPPYNTGSDGFVYPDNFEYSDDQLKDMFGLNDDKLKRLKSIQGKATHSAWLTFMYPRLYLAKKVLKETGVIFVSIDDNEQANLKLLMDEVFGEASFIDQLMVEMSNTGGMKLNAAKDGAIAKNGEFVLIYTKRNYNFDSVKRQPLYDFVEGFDTHYSLFLDDDSKVKPLIEIINQNDSILLDYSTITGGTSKKISLKSFADIFDKSDAAKKFVLDNLEKITRERTEIPNIPDAIIRDLVQGEWKVYKSVKRQAPYNLGIKNGIVVQYAALSENYNKTDSFNTVYGRSVIRGDYWKEFWRDMGNVSKEDGVEFKNGKKPIRLIKQLIKWSGVKNGIVMDFFAGSGTTASAVLNDNAENSSNNQFILVQLPENLDERLNAANSSSKKDIKAQINFLDSHKRPHFIDELTKQRIFNASIIINNKFKNLSKNFDFGFKHYRVVAPTQETLEKIDYDDQLQLDLFDDMIDAFSSEKLGVTGNADGFDTILYTYLAKDNYQFDVPLQMKDFAGIQLPYVNNQRIYLIANNWQAENTRALVNAIGKNELVVQTIVVYGYTLEMESLRELEIALNQLENKVNLQVRY